MRKNVPDKFAIDYQRVLITMSLLQDVEDSDYTKQHSLRVGRLTKKICEEYGFDNSKCLFYTRTAYFHDVGKIKLTKKVLFKAGILTDDEYTEMKKHPAYSRDILINLGLPKEAEVAIQHHERLDGSGYPFGLKEIEIDMGAKIIAVADVFDAMTADRPYRKACDVIDALLYLYSKSDEHYDIDIIKSLHQVLLNDKKIKNSIDI